MNNFNSKINNFLGRGFTKQAQGFASVRFIHSNIHFIIKACFLCTDSDCK